MSNLSIPEDVADNALFEIVGAYKILTKIAKDAIPINKKRAIEAAALIELAMQQIFPLIPSITSDILKTQMATCQKENPNPN